MIVEGSGGIMVPLSGTYLYLDLAAALRLPVVVVVRPGLGTINHTLLTITALKKRRLRLAGVVVNYASNGKRGLAEKTNVSVIEELSGERLLGIVRYGSDDFDEVVDAL